MLLSISSAIRSYCRLKQIQLMLRKVKLISTKGAT